MQSKPNHKCPHCKQQDFFAWQKITSAFFGPVTCTNCHQQSYVHIIHALKALGAWIIITWVFIGLAYMSRTSFFLLGTIPAAVVAINKFLLQAPMNIINRE